MIEPLQRALAEEKYETPTPIQAQTIPATLQGRDVLGCAQTGTGKTAAFAVPILDRLGRENRKSTPKRPFVLVLAPTRELAIQIGDSFATYGRHLKLRQAVVYGGVNQGKQVRAMNRGAHILVATPGRLLDLMNQGHIKLDLLEMFVLDEADLMLYMGFLPDLKRIISHLPQQRQSLFFSATLPPNIVALSQSLLRDPVSVNVTPETKSVAKIDQRLLYVDRGAKKALLKRILTGDGIERAVVFTKTKRTANVLEKQLLRDGVRATAIHGDKSQNARQRALESFRRQHVQVLVATDVAARGIDIDGISHVVNFDLPIEPENYLHRIGRTGRAGAQGTALSFCCADERRELRAIENLIGQKVPVDLEQSQPEPAEEKSVGTSNRRRNPGSKRSNFQRSAAKHSGAKGGGPRVSRPSRKSEAAGENGAAKPKRQPRRKPKKRFKRAAQTI